MSDNGSNSNRSVNSAVTNTGTDIESSEGDNEDDLENGLYSYGGRSAARSSQSKKKRAIHIENDDSEDDNMKSSRDVSSSNPSITQMLHIDKTEDALTQHNDEHDDDDDDNQSMSNRKNEMKEEVNGGDDQEGNVAKYAKGCFRTGEMWKKVWKKLKSMGWNYGHMGADGNWSHLAPGVSERTGVIGETKFKKADDVIEYLENTDVSILDEVTQQMIEESEPFLKRYQEFTKQSNDEDESESDDENETNAKELNDDDIYNHAWKVMKENGWRWRNGKDLEPYTYIRPKNINSSTNTEDDDAEDEFPSISKMVEYWVNSEHWKKIVEEILASNGLSLDQYKPSEQKIKGKRKRTPAPRQPIYNPDEPAKPKIKKQKAKHNQDEEDGVSISGSNISNHNKSNHNKQSGMTSSTTKRKSGYAGISLLQKVLDYPESQLFEGMMFNFTDDIYQTTSHSSDSVFKEIKTLIKKHGGQVSDDIQEVGQKKVYVLSAPSSFRSFKYMTAVSNGIPCIHYMWVIDCIQQNRRISWIEYILPSGYSFKKESFLYLNNWINLFGTTSSNNSNSDSSKICSLEDIPTANKPLENYKCVIIGGDEDWREKVKILAQETGAQIMDQDDEFKEDDEIDAIICDYNDSSEVTRNKCADVRNQFPGIPVVSLDWLMLNIVEGEECPPSTKSFFKRISNVYCTSKIRRQDVSQPDLSCEWIGPPKEIDLTNNNNYHSCLNHGMRIDVGDFIFISNNSRKISSNDEPFAISQTSDDISGQPKAMSMLRFGKVLRLFETNEKKCQAVVQEYYINQGEIVTDGIKKLLSQLVQSPFEVTCPIDCIQGGLVAISRDRAKDLKICGDNIYWKDRLYVI